MQTLAAAARHLVTALELPAVRTPSLELAYRHAYEAMRLIYLHAGDTPLPTMPAPVVTDAASTRPPGSAIRRRRWRPPTPGSAPTVQDKTGRVYELATWVADAHAPPAARAYFAALQAYNAALRTLRHASKADTSRARSAALRAWTYASGLHDAAREVWGAPPPPTRPF